MKKKILLMAMEAMVAASVSALAAEKDDGGRYNGPYCYQQGGQYGGCYGGYCRNDGNYRNNQ